MADNRPQPRSESFRKIKKFFIITLVSTLLFTIFALVIALKTCDQQLERADAATSDRDVRQMYATIRPILSGLIVFFVIIEWTILGIGIIGAVREHYELSLVFVICQAIGLISSLFQIGPVLFELKIVWVLIDIISTAMSAVFVYCLRCELMRPRFNLWWKSIDIIEHAAEDIWKTLWISKTKERK